jgi:hypothetical protein
MLWSLEILFKTVYLDETETGFSEKIFWSREVPLKTGFTVQGMALNFSENISV